MRFPLKVQLDLSIKKDLQYASDVTSYATQRSSDRHEAIKLNSAEADPSIYCKLIKGS